MALAGSIWVEGDDLHWLNSSAVEKNKTFTLVGTPAGALIGSLWVDGNFLHYIDSSGEERRFNGVLIGSPGGALIGSLWVEGDNIRYIDSSGEERSIVSGAGCTGTIDEAQSRICKIATCGPPCLTLKGCASNGEKHRVCWSHTGCDAACEIAIHLALNGGVFVEIQDGVACCPADPDAGCCEMAVNCTDDCNVIYTKFECSTGSNTYAYKVRLETAGTDTEISSATASTKTGNNTTCIA